MKRLILIITCLGVYSFILLSCAGVQPTSNSATTPTIKPTRITKGETINDTFESIDGSTPPLDIYPKTCVT